MECPRCKKYIKSTENSCSYCGNKINKSFMRKLWEFICCERINEKKFIESVSNGDFPPIKSIKEVELYVRHKIQDEEVAIIVCEGMERAGADGFFEVKRGGYGNPYKIEYLSNRLPLNMSKKEVEKKIEKLRNELKNNNLSEDKKESILGDIRQLTRNYVIIWVNSSSEKDFNEKHQLITDAFAVATEILTGKIKI